MDTAHYTEHVYTRMLTDAQAMYVGTHARMHVDTHVYAHTRLTCCVYFIYVYNVVMRARPLAGLFKLVSVLMRPLPASSNLFLTDAVSSIK